MELWSKAVEGAAVKQVDVAAALSELLATKDAGDIQKAKKAAFLAASAMKTFAVQELERVARCASVLFLNKRALAMDTTCTSAHIAGQYASEQLNCIWI